jgi:hypothetical protein
MDDDLDGTTAVSSKTHFRLVTLTFASWNLIGRFLRQLDSVRQVA